MEAHTSTSLNHYLQALGKGHMNFALAPQSQEQYFLRGLYPCLFHWHYRCVGSKATHKAHRNNNLHQ